MNTLLENFTSMVVRVANFLVEQVVLLTPLHKYTETKTGFDGHLAELQTTSMQQQTNTKGRTLLKQQRKTELIESLMQVVTFLMAYATLESKTELLSQVDTKPFKLRKLAVNSLRALAQEIWETATALQTAIEPYGLRDAHLDNLQAAIAAFVAVMQMPQESKDLKKQLTARLKQLRQTLETDLDKFDKLIDLLWETNPELCELYYNLRGIDELGGSKVALTGKATDADTGIGMKAVIFTFTKTPNGKEAGSPELTKSVKRSGAKGGFMLKSLAPGTYSCSVTFEGYLTQTFNVYVNAGVLTRVSVALVKAA
jgi:hypothetical protein